MDVGWFASQGAHYYVGVIYSGILYQVRDSRAAMPVVTRFATPPLHLFFASFGIVTSWSHSVGSTSLSKLTKFGRTPGIFARFHNWECISTMDIYWSHLQQALGHLTVRLSQLVVVA